MVSTRSHPSNFPPPDLSPGKAVAGRQRSLGQRHWIHKPTALTLLWLAISLPLVFWDSAYVALRPHSMPGGKWHRPIFTPYALYGTIDYIYGWPAYESGNGFTLAQGSLNILESIGYIGYIWVFWQHGEGLWTYAEGQKRSIGGGWGGVACLFGFSLSLLTFSKTVLYCTRFPSNIDAHTYREQGLMSTVRISTTSATTTSSVYFSCGSYQSTSRFLSALHGYLLTPHSLASGLWLIFPAYMIYTFGADVLDGLAIAGGDTGSMPAKLAASSKDE